MLTGWGGGGDEFPVSRPSPLPPPHVRVHGGRRPALCRDAADRAQLRRAETLHRHDHRKIQPASDTLSPTPKTCS